MRIAEIYLSIQGEGLLTGTESVFVRASGCNLRCRFCDTPYTSWFPEGDDLSVDEILVDVGTADPFIENELRPELLERACADAGIALTLRRQAGYDHSYYFISTFMPEHLRWHAERLRRG